MRRKSHEREEKGAPPAATVGRARTRVLLKYVVVGANATLYRWHPVREASIITLIPLYAETQDSAHAHMCLEHVGHLDHFRL